MKTGAIWAMLALAVIVCVGLFILKAQAEGGGYSVPSFRGGSGGFDFDYNSLPEYRAKSRAIRDAARSSSWSSYGEYNDKPTGRHR